MQFRDLLTGALILALAPHTTAVPSGNGHAESSKSGSNKHAATGPHAVGNIPTVDCGHHLSRLNHALHDVHTLATFAGTHYDPASSAWTNYFRLNGNGLRQDTKFVKALWKTTSHVTNHNRPYEFRIVCEPKTNTDCARGSVAWADPLPVASVNKKKAAKNKKNRDRKKAKKIAVNRGHHGGHVARSEGEEAYNEDAYDEQVEEFIKRSGRSRSKNHSLSHRPKHHTTEKGKGKRPKHSSSSENSEEEKRKKKNPKAKLKSKSPSPSNKKEELRAIHLCPIFFGLKTLTELDLRRVQSSETTSTGRPSRGKGKNEGVCARGTIFSHLETMGMSFLHELTHLDAVGRLSGLGVAEDNARGTIDALDGAYLPAARELGDMWHGTVPRAPDAAPPYRNAESVAASAFEFYYLEHCGHDGHNYDVPIVH